MQVSDPHRILRGSPGDWDRDSLELRCHSLRTGTRRTRPWASDMSSTSHPSTRLATRSRVA